MNNSTLIAHVRKNEDGLWAPPQPLIDHLEGSTRLASKFAETLNSSFWAYAEGLAHDIGKATPAWEHYLGAKSGYDEEAHLETKQGKRDHSTPSASLSHSAPSFEVTLAARISHDIWKGREEYRCYIRTRNDYDWEVGLDIKRCKVGHSPACCWLSLRYNKAPPIEGAPSHQCKDEESTNKVSAKEPHCRRMLINIHAVR